MSDEEVRRLQQETIIRLEVLDQEDSKLKSRRMEIDRERSLQIEKLRLMKRVPLDSDEPEPSRSASPAGSNDLAEGTIAQGAEIILRESNRMMSAKEISDILADRGREFNGKTPRGEVVGTTLRRYPRKFQWSKYNGVNHYRLV